MPSESLRDVPSPVDLRQMSDARAWAEAAMAKHPWRKHFFTQIASQIAQLKGDDLSILEIGSGPGFLARRVLEVVSQVSYFALDFSSAMHTLAKERLGSMADRVRFVEGDFKTRNWANALPRFDAVLAVQAVHELRHKRHAPALFRTARTILKPAGVFFMCDHFVGEGAMSNRSLYMTPAEHEAALRAGGFQFVDLLLVEGGLILFRASYGTA